MSDRLNDIHESEMLLRGFSLSVYLTPLVSFLKSEFPESIIDIGYEIDATRELLESLDCEYYSKREVDPSSTHVERFIRQKLLAIPFSIDSIAVSKEEGITKTFYLIGHWVFFVKTKRSTDEEFKVTSKWESVMETSNQCVITNKMKVAIALVVSIVLMIYVATLWYHNYRISIANESIAYYERKAEIFSVQRKLSTEHGRTFVVYTEPPVGEIEWLSIGRITDKIPDDYLPHQEIETLRPLEYGIYKDRYPLTIIYSLEKHYLVYSSNVLVNVEYF